MLGWLTFAAALLAAVGAVIGPVIAYRASIKTIQAEQQIETARQRQESVERLIEQATGDNPTLSTYALSQLDYLLNAGQLTIEQTTAARNAIEAVMSRLQHTVGSADLMAGRWDESRRRRPAVPDAATVSPVDVQRARLLVRLNRTLGATSPAYVITVAEAQTPVPAAGPETDTPTSGS